MTKGGQLAPLCSDALSQMAPENEWLETFSVCFKANSAYFQVQTGSFRRVSRFRAITAVGSEIPNNHLGCIKPFK